jgi:hypothetical protein
MVNKKILVLISEWCKPCSILKETLNTIDTDINFEFIDDGDKIYDYSNKFNLNMVPVMLMYDDENNFIKLLKGNRPKEEIMNWINEE